MSQKAIEKDVMYMASKRQKAAMKRHAKLNGQYVIMGRNPDCDIYISSLDARRHWTVKTDGTIVTD